MHTLLPSWLSSIPVKCCLLSALWLGCQSSPCSLRWLTYKWEIMPVCECVRVHVLSVCVCSHVQTHLTVRACVFVHNQLKHSPSPFWCRCAVEQCRVQLRVGAPVGNGRSSFLWNISTQFCPFPDDKWHKLTLGSAMQSIAGLRKAVLVHSSGVKPL